MTKPSLLGYPPHGIRAIGHPERTGRRMNFGLGDLAPYNAGREFHD
ncbi:MAG: hypothetical protein ACI8Y4_002429 [Candidatus Poriferisodalaceae bacterium]|jgi:hypothetical protein